MTITYVDGSNALSPTEAENLTDLAVGVVPVKTANGFTAATTANVPETGDSLYVLAEQRTLLGTLATGGWLDRFANMAATYATGAAEIRTLKPAVATDATNLVDASMEGGGISFKNRAYVELATEGIVLNAANTPWAVAFDMLTQVPTSGKFFMLGLKALGFVEYIGWWNNYDAGADFHTQLVQRSYNGGSGENTKTWTIDANRHVVMLAFDGTSLRTIVDGTVYGTSTDKSAFSTHPMVPFGYSDLGWLLLSRIAIATVY
jgi:hypothetical protein